MPGSAKLIAANKQGRGCWLSQLWLELEARVSCRLESIGIGGGEGTGSFTKYKIRLGSAS